jgi:phosphoribosylformimino-5-aminoimidazole carboxamide ribotide isomerase
VILVPSIDLRAGRSRIVFWPGTAAGTGAPTDRPDQIARHFVDLGAPMLHLVDLDGAAHGAPANIDALGRIARAVGVPIQLAGGVDGPDQIELAFAGGATRVVVPLWSVAESPATLSACLARAGDWLAVGMDARADRLRDYPWRGRPRALEELATDLAGSGVCRFVVAHWAPADLPRLAALGAANDVEIQLAGGAGDIDGVAAARDSGVAALILGEALLSGAVDYAAAMAQLADTRRAVAGSARG